MDGEDNHVHLLVEYPPKLAVSVLVNFVAFLWRFCGYRVANYAEA
ncbi:hypothetical protein FEMY_21580 [Ferrovum myxofaciens]|uniref:Transposase IS200-like domain-containing protein n=1 Tax=Ferrovum myxofaciens TaxID=416213 RepID=A0A149VVQ5_9PROT|nr:hypothetical protein FEMY_21580 [Ferrovum myxofaciens]